MIYCFNMYLSNNNLPPPRTKGCFWGTLLRSSFQASQQGAWIELGYGQRYRFCIYIQNRELLQQLPFPLYDYTKRELLQQLPFPLIYTPIGSYYNSSLFLQFIHQQGAIVIAPFYQTILSAAVIGQAKMIGHLHKSTV